MAVRLVRQPQSLPAVEETSRSGLLPLPAQRTPVSPHPLTSRERIGYIFWGSLAALILATEAIAAFWSGFPVPTISGTTGHLEGEHHWVKLIVLGGIVILATRIIFYPWPYRRLDD